MSFQDLLGTKTPPHFQIYQSVADDYFYWRLYYGNEIIATGHQRYEDIEDAKAEIRRVKMLAPIADLQQGYKRE